MEFQLRKIGHVVLDVTDLEASLRFYTEVLGCAAIPTTTAWPS